jgi:DNA-binding transcriptional ArsR family regulator
MERRGIGENQIQQLRTSKRKIQDALKDEDWHRYQTLQKQTELSTATLSKHLKRLVMGGIVEKKIDIESGEYPYPVYYRLKHKIHPELPSEWSQKADAFFTKQKPLRHSIHWMNLNVGLLLISLLREYLKNPSQNEEMFNQATEYNIISLSRNFFENIKLRLKEMSENGENVEQILTEFQNQFLNDYKFLIKEMVAEAELL